MKWVNIAKSGMAAFALLSTAAAAQVRQTEPPSPAWEAAAEAMQAGMEDLRFDPERDANADVDAALSAAQASGRHVLVIFGGDWCHDSMAIADLFDSDRFAAMLAQRYELVWVHVPFSRDERSIATASRFGLGDVVGTPTMLILTPQGQPTNLSDAPTWRNAASRKPEAVYRHFSRAVAPAVIPAP